MTVHVDYQSLFQDSEEIRHLTGTPLLDLAPGHEGAEAQIPTPLEAVEAGPTPTFGSYHEGLEARDFNVMSHERVPANDGGLTLGQAVVALARHQDC